MSNHNNIPEPTGYFTVSTVDAVRPDEMTVVQVNGRCLILTRWQDKVVAFSNRCPHASADLAEGELHRGRITCPDHGYKFDVGNGRILWPEDEVYRLKRYEVLEENGTIKVKLT